MPGELTRALGVARDPRACTRGEIEPKYPRRTVHGRADRSYSRHVVCHFFPRTSNFATRRDANQAVRSGRGRPAKIILICWFATEQFSLLGSHRGTLRSRSLSFSLPRPLPRSALARHSLFFFRFIITTASNGMTDRDYYPGDDNHFSLPALSPICFFNPSAL